MIFIAKLADIVIEVMNNHNQFDIDIGCNSMFVDIYNRLENKPTCDFEKWKSNVIQKLIKDSRFICNKTSTGIKNHKTNIVELKGECYETKRL